MGRTRCDECETPCIFTGFLQVESGDGVPVRHIHYEKGDVVFRQEAPVFACHVVCRGTVDGVLSDRSGDIVGPATGDAVEGAGYLDIRAFGAALDTTEDPKEIIFALEVNAPIPDAARFEGSPMQFSFYIDVDYDVRPLGLLPTSSEQLSGYWLRFGFEYQAVVTYSRETLVASLIDLETGYILDPALRFAIEGATLIVKVPVEEIGSPNALLYLPAAQQREPEKVIDVGWEPDGTAAPPPIDKRKVEGQAILHCNCCATEGPVDFHDERILVCPDIGDPCPPGTVLLANINNWSVPHFCFYVPADSNCMGGDCNANEVTDCSETEELVMISWETPSTRNWRLTIVSTVNRDHCIVKDEWYFEYWHRCWPGLWIHQEVQETQEEQLR
jgi:hypothetical protein